MTARTRLCEVAGLAVEYGPGEVAIACPGPPLVVRALQGLVDAQNDNDLARRVTLNAARGVLSDGWRHDGAKHFALPPVAVVLVTGRDREALPRAVQKAALWADSAAALPGPEEVGGIAVDVLVEDDRRYVVLKYEGAFYSRLPAGHAFVLAHALVLAAKAAQS